MFNHYLILTDGSLLQDCSNLSSPNSGLEILDPEARNFKLNFSKDMIKFLQGFCSEILFVDTVKQFCFLINRFFAANNLVLKAWLQKIKRNHP